MSLSSANLVGEIPGITLRAWVLTQNGGGILKGFNVSSCAFVGAGQYTVTFAVPTDANYIVTAKANGANGAVEPYQVNLSGAGGVNSCTLLLQVNGVSSQPMGAVWIGFYG